MTEEFTSITTVLSREGHYQLANRAPVPAPHQEPLGVMTVAAWSNLYYVRLTSTQRVVRVNTRTGKRLDEPNLVARVNRPSAPDDPFEIYAEKIDPETARWVNSL